MANPTAETFIGLARNLLKEDSGSDVPVVQDSFMLTALSDGNMKWARAFRGNGSAPIVFSRETGFDLVSETAINDSAGTTTATTTITVDSTTGYDSAGIAIIWDDDMPDIFAYTGKTATTFTGVTGLAFAHEDNDPIQPAYGLPSNFGYFRKSVEYGDGVQLEGVPLSYMGGFPNPGFFSLHDDGTTKYLILSRQATGSASVLYDKISTTIDSLDDTVDVPTEYQFFLAWHLVAFAYIGRENDYGRMIAAQNESNKILQEDLRDRNVGKKIRPRTFGRVARDYVVVDGQYLPLG